MISSQQECVQLLYRHQKKYCYYCCLKNYHKASIAHTTFKECCCCWNNWKIGKKKNIWLNGINIIIIIISFDWIVDEQKSHCACNTEKSWRKLWYFFRVRHNIKHFLNIFISFACCKKNKKIESSVQFSFCSIKENLLFCVTLFLFFVLKKSVILCKKRTRMTRIF